MAATDPSAFEVHPYSLEALIRLIARLSGVNTEAEIRAKPHPAYLDGYFKHGGVRTIVVERVYVDRDYLDDFADYYVRCFEKYERYCSRLHFFAQAFNEKQFRDILNLAARDERMQRFRSSYCGFIVIKPLPQTVFGRTCLRTYPSNENRYFPAARCFGANLFGIPLEIPQTLPFQEQDSIVAACATSALWSVLQATAKEFQHALLTPIEITRAATEFSPTDNRMIPNRGGLSTAMMAEAIRRVELEPLLLEIPPDDEITLRSALYAYLQARIPLILGIALVDVSKPRRPVPIGEHAVAVSGYHLSDKRPKRARKTGFRHRATGVDKIYVHDDQLGPFARMSFDGIRVKLPIDGSRSRNHQSLSTTWQSENGSENVRAIPRMLLIPLYHKIRIPYADVFQAVIQFDGFLKTLSTLTPHSALGDLEWDIHLTTVNDLKVKLQHLSQLKGASRVRWLTRSMPRFLWRAMAYSMTRPTLEVLFDATDIHTSNGIHGVIFYEREVEDMITLIAHSTRTALIPNLGLWVSRILTSISNEGSKR